MVKYRAGRQVSNGLCETKEATKCEILKLRRLRGTDAGLYTRMRTNANHLTECAQGVGGWVFEKCPNLRAFNILLDPKFDNKLRSIKTHMNKYMYSS